MLRAAVAAGSPIGRKAKEIMDRGDLVSDDVVIGIIADRIEEPDAKAGFILDGFPRTVAQAEAFDAMLARRGLKLDAVIEFKVDEYALVDRIVKRAKETEARGEAVRKDDNPDIFRTRLEAYRAQTAPLSAYYAAKGALKTVDGMKPVDEVTRAVSQIIGR
jgi:adenylate kinase